MNTRKNKNAKFSTGFKIVLSGGMLALGVALLYAQEPIQEPARGPQFWKFTGWACLPDMGKKLMGENPLHRDCEPREYFFLSVKARASQRAVEKGNVQMMRSTCRAAARSVALGNEKARRMFDFMETRKVVQQGDRQAVITEFNGTVRGAGLYECCPHVAGGKGCAKKQTKWEQCICLAYWRYPGGQKALLEKAKPGATKKPAARPASTTNEARTAADED